MKKLLMLLVIIILTSCSTDALSNDNSKDCAGNYIKGTFTGQFTGGESDTVDWWVVYINGKPISVSEYDFNHYMSHAYTNWFYKTITVEAIPNTFYTIGSGNCDIVK